MKTPLLKKLLGAIILAIFAFATFVLFKQLPPMVKLLFLAVDVAVYYLVMRFLIFARALEKILSTDPCSSVASLTGRHYWNKHRNQRTCFNCGAKDEQSIEDGKWYIKSRE